MNQSLGKTGSTAINKIGHTYSNKFGSEPNAKVKGSTTPTDITFGK